MRARWSGVRGSRRGLRIDPAEYGLAERACIYDRVIDSLASALQKNGTKQAVVLSSIGADKPDKTGPVVGLHRMEEKLNRSPG